MKPVILYKYNEYGICGDLIDNQNKTRPILENKIFNAIKTNLILANLKFKVASQMKF